MKLKMFCLWIAVSLVIITGCTTSEKKAPITVVPISPSPEPTIAPIEATPVPLIPTSTSSSSPTPEPTIEPTSAPTNVVDPFDLISQESLLHFTGDLTAIQPYSGWRNSATKGEAEALDYVARQLDGFPFLNGLGLELERQEFHVYLGTELWETRLHVTVNGEEIEVPADGLRGPREDIPQALCFDSDGRLNDDAGDPMVATGPAVLVRSADNFGQADLRDKIVFLDYAVVDRVLMGRQKATDIASDLLAQEPAGVVMVTQFSSAPGESHGTFVGDLSAMTGAKTGSAPPVLYARLEDLAPAGIADWDDLTQVEAARLTWDADVFSPGQSGNLVARIPGADPSSAVILGAHIDSPNGPGAMDDGSGSVILLEIARVLEEARHQPPVDLYLVWFGSEELGLYGSYHFVSTHQELLDRTLAMLQIDMLSRPLDGIDAYLNLVTWSYGHLGDDRLTWPDYVSKVARTQGVETVPINYYGIESDNSAFAGFDVPNANLIYMNGPAMYRLGSVHYACHIHDPYDTVGLAREVADVLEEMAHVALAAGLETGRDDPSLRIPPPPDRRALFLAGHTEAVHVGPTTFTDLGMTLAWEGFDVDVVPYGQIVDAEGLSDADLVVALPVLDYPGPDSDVTAYDEAWTPEEIDALDAYVADGGFLVLTNSAHRLKYANWTMEVNEDRDDVNPLAERFGVIYGDGSLTGDVVQPVEGGSLMEDVTSLTLATGNGVPFEIQDGQVLGWAGNDIAVALLDHGQGEILALADVGLLGNAGGEPANLTFWTNLAQYVRSR